MFAKFRGPVPIRRRSWSWVLWLALLAACAGAPPPERPSLSLTDLDGEPFDPFAAPGKVRVFIFARTDCPISNRYAPEVNRLAQRFGDRGVRFWLVYVDRTQRTGAIRDHMREFGYGIDALRDSDHSLVAYTEATITPEVAVFDTGDRLAYRGRIDNRYEDYNRARQQATQHDLEQALEAVLAGRPVRQRFTDAVGCYIVDLR